MTGLPGDSDGQFPLTVLGIFFFVWTALLLLYRRWSQGRQPLAGEVMARDSRKPVLYLRPFAADANQFQVGSARKPDSARAEALILEPFEILGPLVAIGRPGEGRPPWGGAARIYVDDDWQSRFRELLDQAQLAVLFAGTTGNFQWELGQVFHREPFVPVVLLMPFDGPHRNSFESSFSAATSIELPEAARGACVLYFPTRNQPIPFAGTSGDAVLFNLPTGNPYLGALIWVVESIRPGSAEPWRKKARQNRSARIGGTAIGIVVTVFILAAKGCSGH